VVQHDEAEKLPQHDAGETPRPSFRPSPPIRTPAGWANHGPAISVVITLAEDSDEYVIGRSSPGESFSDGRRAALQGNSLWLIDPASRKSIAAVLAATIGTLSRPRPP